MYVVLYSVAMAQLNAILDGYKGDLLKVARKSATELGARVKDGTPIDSGDARKSWKDNGPLVIGKRYEYLSRHADCPYMRPLEYGHSQQAPRGMVRINVIKWRSIVRKHAKSI